MKRVFLDTNIIVDFLTSRAPYCDEARTIMALGINKKNKTICCINVLCYSKLSYS